METQRREVEGLARRQALFRSLRFPALSDCGLAQVLSHANVMPPSHLHDGWSTLLLGSGEIKGTRVQVGDWYRGTIAKFHQEFGQVLGMKFSDRACAPHVCGQLWVQR